MRPAGCLPDAASLVQSIEAGIGIGLQRALELRQMPVWNHWRTRLAILGVG